MRIFNQAIPGLHKAYNQQNKTAPVQGAPAQDEIKISEQARFFQVAQKALKELPAAKPQDLAQLRQKIDSGSYHVAPEDLAQRIWQESFGG